MLKNMSIFSLRKKIEKEIQRKKLQQKLFV